MIEKPRGRFSITLEATIWNVLPVPGRPWVIVEERNDNARLVSVSAINYENETLVWKTNSLAETWWINLVRVTPDQVHLKIFENTSNPDKTYWQILAMESGEDIQETPKIETKHTNEAIYPFQYLAGEADFETIKTFLTRQLNVLPILGVEYTEYVDFVFISYYFGSPGMFNNNLACFKSTGELLWQEEIGTNLKGIGVNTFFLVANQVFFVKNKTELVTFGIV
ncbi:MAG: DUF4905 domain-containing protein [Cyclobacteriaceae bacterium]|nr:DUF4905 domain-containing protein [Cyclobacteriaceae bacterium]